MRKNTICRKVVDVSAYVEHEGPVTCKGGGGSFLGQ